MSTPWISIARASTDEQTTSCAQQHADNERSEGGPPVARFDDDGVSGSVSVRERAGFMAAIGFLRKCDP